MYTPWVKYHGLYFLHVAYNVWTSTVCLHFIISHRFLLDECVYLEQPYMERYYNMYTSFVW